MEIPHDQQLEHDRHNFFQRLEQHFSPETRILIHNAYDLAAHFHADDIYGGGPYEVHVRGVATKCMDSGFVREQDAPTVAAALLHDVPEKHEEELITYAKSHEQVNITDPHTAITRLTDSNVAADIVLGATNTPKGQLYLPAPYESRSTGYHGDLRFRLLHPDTPARTIAVKTFDVEFNVETLHSIPADTDEQKRQKIVKRIVKYMDCVPILIEAYNLRIAGNTDFTQEQQEAVLDSINAIKLMLAQAEEIMQEESGSFETELAGIVGKLLVAV